MGLGKTIQVVAFLTGLFDMQQVRSVLIVLPVAVIINWEREFEKWAPGINVQCFHGSSKREKERALCKVQRRGGVLLTSYGLVLTSFQKIMQLDGREFIWDYIILDEGHKIKNPGKTTKAIHSVPAKHRFILTGTPIQNNLKEMWALFDFVTHGSILGTIKTFMMEYGNPITRARERDATSSEKLLGNEMAESLRNLIEPYFLRRTKADVLENNQNSSTVVDSGSEGSISEGGCRLVNGIPRLTRKNDFIIWLYLTETQIQIYKDFSQLDQVKELLMSTRSPLAELTVLKKLCDHPRLLSARACHRLGLQTTENIEDVSVDDEHSPDVADARAAACNIKDIDDDILMAESGKIQFLLELLHNLTAQGHRTLVFSQSRKMLDIVEKILRNQNFKYMRLDGTVSKLTDREQRINCFQSNESYTVFLLTTQVGGVGLTLTGADRVVIIDPSWNPATDNQAVDRAYRIGQTKSVVIYRLITCGTVEEKIYRRQIFKDSITKQATGASKNPYRYFSRQDLKELFLLDDPKRSKTQEQLEEMHSASRKSDTNLDSHIAFLHSLESIYGISDHDLMFSQEAVKEDHEGFESVTEDYIQKRVQRAQELVSAESDLTVQLKEQLESNTEPAGLHSHPSEVNTDRARLKKLWEKVHGEPDDKRVLKPGADYEERFVSKKIPEPEIEYDLTTLSSDEDERSSEDEADMDPHLISAINESMEDGDNIAARQASLSDENKSLKDEQDSSPKINISSILIEDSDDEMMKSPDMKDDKGAVGRSADNTPASTSSHSLSSLERSPARPAQNQSTDDYLDAVNKTGSILIDDSEDEVEVADMEVQCDTFDSTFEEPIEAEKSTNSREMDTDDGEKYDRDGENPREMSRETDVTDKRKSEREGIKTGMESFGESPGRERNPEEISRGASENPEEVETSDSNITGDLTDDHQSRRADSGNITEDLQNGRNDEEVDRNVTEDDTAKDDSSDNPWDDPSDQDNYPRQLPNFHGNNSSNHRNGQSNHSDDLVDASMSEQEEAPSRGNSFFTSLEEDDLAAGDNSNQMRTSEDQGQDDGENRASNDDEVSEEESIEVTDFEMQCSLGTTVFEDTDEESSGKEALEAAISCKDEDGADYGSTRVSREVAPETEEGLHLNRRDSFHSELKEGGISLSPIQGPAAYHDISPEVSGREERSRTGTGREEKSVSSKCQSTGEVKGQGDFEGEEDDQKETRGKETISEYQGKDGGSRLNRSSERNDSGRLDQSEERNQSNDMNESLGVHKVSERRNVKNFSARQQDSKDGELNCSLESATNRAEDSPLVTSGKGKRLFAPIGDRDLDVLFDEAPTSTPNKGDGKERDAEDVPFLSARQGGRDSLVRQKRKPRRLVVNSDDEEEDGETGSESVPSYLIEDSFEEDWHRGSKLQKSRASVVQESDGDVSAIEESFQDVMKIDESDSDYICREAGGSTPGADGSEGSDVKETDERSLEGTEEGMNNLSVEGEGEKFIPRDEDSLPDVSINKEDEGGDAEMQEDVENEEFFDARETTATPHVKKNQRLHRNEDDDREEEETGDGSWREEDEMEDEMEDEIEDEEEEDYACSGELDEEEQDKYYQYLEKGEEYLENGRKSKALKCFLMALDVDSTSQALQLRTYSLVREREQMKSQSQN
ncbi:uncharacterized protein [Apostichopus japonicus]